MGAVVNVSLQLQNNNFIKRHDVNLNFTFKRTILTPQMASAMTNMEEYFRVSVERKLFISIPDQDEHDLTPATRILERRREMLEVESGLVRQKEEFAMKIESLTQRREELVRKECQLKESLYKFDKFLKVS